MRLSLISASSLAILITAHGMALGQPPPPPGQKATAASLELLSKDVEIAIPWAKNVGVQPPVIFITAQDADASQVSVQVIGIAQGGIPFPRQALNFQPTSFPVLKKDQPAPVVVNLSPDLLRRPGKYNARILL